LYTRIRRSYDCTLTPPASEIHFAAPANLLAFTCPFYQTAGHSINVSAQKNEFIIITTNLKNATAGGGGIYVVVRKPIEI
jgi:hypothetical protein